MFLKKIKDIIIKVDKKFLKSSIIDTYLKLKYYLEIKKIYISIENGDFEKKKRHTLNKELVVSLTSYSKRFKTLLKNFGKKICINRC